MVHCKDEITNMEEVELYLDKTSLPAGRLGYAFISESDIRKLDLKLE